MIATLGKVGTGFDLANEKLFDAWGAVRQGEPAGSHIVNPNTGYCANLGHKFDGESNMLYMRARYYEPSTGRFISEDPARDGVNWYVYCGSDPVNRSDYSGRHWERIWKGFKFLFHGNDNLPNHIHIYDVGSSGSELFSRRLVGGAWHGDGGSFPRKILEALIKGIRSGDTTAMNIGRRLVQRGYGIATEMLDELRAALGIGFAIIAYTSVDAYAQVNPEDFVAILRNIAGDTSA